MDDIAITGIGAVLPTGAGIDAAWDCWNRSDSRIARFSHPLLYTRRITHFGAISDELRAGSRETTPFKLRRYATEPSLWAIHATGQAISNADIDWNSIDETRRGAFTGQGDYSFPHFDSFKASLAAGRHTDGRLDERAFARHALYRRGADPFISIKSLANNALALISLTFRCRGVGCAYVQNEAAGIAALNRAIRELREDRCDVALVIASGSYAEPFTLAQLWARGLLGSEHSPPERVAGFDTDARGVVLGEGAMVLLLERSQSANARKARIHALIDTANGRASRSYRSEILAEPMYRHIVPVDLHDGAWAVLADGRGHADLDRAECVSLRDALPAGMPVSSCRAIGGVIPAAGALFDIAMATQVLTHASLPPIAGLQRPIDDTIAWTQDDVLVHDFDRVLCLQQGFSGYYSAATVRRAA